MMDNQKGKWFVSGLANKTICILMNCGHHKLAITVAQSLS